MITAKILKYSVPNDPVQDGLLTFELVYPRFIHCEVMTHRAASKNSASSRAIPFEVMVKSIDENIAMPEFWGTEQSGMQSGPSITCVEDFEYVQQVWRDAFLDAVKHATRLRACPSGLRIHKSICNRLLEPFAHMTVVFTITVPMFHHMMALRAHKDAQPEFQVAAYRMLNAFQHAKPDILEPGQWHMPFGDLMPIDVLGDIPRQLRIATARCARASYCNHDGTNIPEHKDHELHDRLKQGDPIHASPFEHCALYTDSAPLYQYEHNFGAPWVQYRKLIPKETVLKIDTYERLRTRPNWITL
jgi:hypothetical protein